MQLARPHFRSLSSIEWRRVAALLLSLVAIAIGLWSWMAYTALARTEPLIVLAVDVPPGSRLTAEMLKVVQVPPQRDASLQGLSDASALLGTYTRVQLKKDDILRPDYLQQAPLDAHIYTNSPLPAETLTEDVFQLSPKGIVGVTAQDHLNILVVIGPEQGALPAVSVGAMDAPGSGPRVVRVLRNLNVLHVGEQAVELEVTHAQSQYLWALAAAHIDFVGELATAPDAPLGPLRPQDATVLLLAMGAPVEAATLAPSDEHAGQAPPQATPVSVTTPTVPQR